MNKKCKHDIYYYCDKAENSGLKVDFNSFGHPIIESPDKQEAIMLPNNMKSSHMEGAIKKWLIRFGILCAFIAVWYCL